MGSELEPLQNRSVLPTRACRQSLEFLWPVSLCLFRVRLVTTFKSQPTTGAILQSDHPDYDRFGNFVRSSAEHRATPQRLFVGKKLEGHNACLYRSF